MQTFNFSALGREINAAGTYVRYERETTGAADASIRVRVNGNDLGLWLPGDYVSLPEAFARVEIIPIAGAVGEVRIGNGLFSSSRIVMQGTVSIEDLAKTTTEASKAGMGHVLAAQSLGNYAGVFLKNTSATKKIYVRRLAVGARETGAGWKLGVVSAGSPGAAIAGQNNNKKTSGAAMAGELRAMFAAGAAWVPSRIVTAVDYVAPAYDGLPGLVLIGADDDPIALDPGHTLGLYHTVAAGAASGYACSALIHWQEE